MMVIASPLLGDVRGNACLAEQQQYFVVQRGAHFAREEHERLLRQMLETQRAAGRFRQRMPFRHHRHQRFPQQQLIVQHLRQPRIAHYPQIQLTVQQRLDLLFSVDFAHFDMHLREC